MSDCCNPASVISLIGLSDHNSDNWSTLYRTVTCEDKLDIFMKVINTGLDRIAFFHVNLSNYTLMINHACVTPEFKELIKDKQKAYHDGKTQKYNYLRNLVNRKRK